jgi:glutathione S-transferase
MSNKLYGFKSPNPVKVRIALEELGLEYDYQHVDLYKKENRRPEFLALNPRGKVPVLRLGGLTICESNASLTYLGERYGKLWPTVGDSDHGRALDLLFLEGSAFQDLAGVFFFNKVVLPRIGKPPDKERGEKASLKLEPIFKVLLNQLEDKDYLFGGYTLVDCAYGAWLPYLELDEFPALVSWRERIMGRPSWSLASQM